MKLLALYPPGGKFQRGEDRCQASIDESLTVSQRACNDLGYIAAIARKYSIESKIADYPSEHKTILDLENDLREYRPDIIFLSSTAGSIIEDSEIFEFIKKHLPDTIIISKGALFTTLTYDELAEYEKYMSYLDYAVKGEAEVCLDYFFANFSDQTKREQSPGLIYKKNNKWSIPAEHKIVEQLDSLPFPARDLMKNELYIRPDNGKPMATIESSRGCPSSCIYCLTPVISGKTVRLRSPENIIVEIEECISKYNIKNFFFRSDTFTINKQWVLKLCSLIIEKKIDIEWAANGRVKPLDFETLKKMKEAGCWLIAFGIESGAEESLRKMKKGAALEDARRAVAAAKKAGLETYGFFMFGFPWETEEHINKTINFAVELDCDYAEFHIATAFKGTQLFDMLPEKLTNAGANYFGNPNNINENISAERLLEYRRKAVRIFYLRLNYVIKRVFKIRSFYQLKSYIIYGFKALNIIFKTR